MARYYGVYDSCREDGTPGVPDYIYPDPDEAVAFCAKLAASNAKAIRIPRAHVMVDVHQDDHGTDFMGLVYDDTTGEALSFVHLAWVDEVGRRRH